MKTYKVILTNNEEAIIKTEGEPCLLFENGNQFYKFGYSFKYGIFPINSVLAIILVKEGE